MILNLKETKPSCLISMLKIFSPQQHSYSATKLFAAYNLLFLLEKKQSALIPRQTTNSLAEKPWLFLCPQLRELY